MELRKKGDIAEQNADDQKINKLSSLLFYIYDASILK
jgi:hypothetical protein